MSEAVAQLDVVINPKDAQIGATQVKNVINDIKKSSVGMVKSLSKDFTSLKTIMAKVFSNTFKSNIMDVAKGFIKASEAAQRYKAALQAISKAAREADAVLKMIKRDIVINPSAITTGATQIKNVFKDIKKTSASMATSLRKDFSSIKGVITKVFSAAFRNSINSISKSFSKAAETAEKYRIAMSEVSKVAREADTTFKIIKRDVNKVKTSATQMKNVFNKVRKSHTQMTQSMNKNSAKMVGTVKKDFLSLKNIMATFIGITAVRGIKNLSKSFINAAATMEGYRTSLRAVSTSIEEADKTFERIKKWAAINPIDTEEAIGAFVKLKAAAVENSESALSTIADLSTVMHRNMVDVAKAIVSVRTIALRNLGIVIQKTKDTATIQFGDVKKTVANNVRDLRRGILAVTEEAIGGSMQRVKEEYNGLADTIRGMWKVFQSDVMGLDKSGPFQVIKDYIIEIRDEWSHFMDTDDYKDTIESLQMSIKSVISVAISGLKSIGKGIVFVNKHSEVLKGTLTAIAAIKLTLGIDHLIRSIPMVITGFKTILALLGTMTGAASALVAVLGVGLYAGISEKAEMTRDAIKDVNKALGDTPTETGIAQLIKNDNRAINTLKQDIKKMQQDYIKENPLGDFSDFLSSESYVKANKNIRYYEEQIKYLNELKENLLESPTDGISNILNKVETDFDDFVGGGGTQSKKSPTELLVDSIRDKMKYMNEDGMSFISVLDKWQAKLEPLSEDWKKIADLKSDIFEADAERLGEQKDAVKELTEMYKRANQEYLSFLSLEHSEGFSTNREYMESLKKWVKRDGLLDKDFFNMTEEERGLFSAYQSSAMEVFNDKLKSINKEFKDKVSDVTGYTAAINACKKEFSGLPLVSEAADLAIEEFADRAKDKMKSLNELTTQWVKDFQEGIADAIVEGKNFGDTLSDIGKEIEKMAVKTILFGENGQSGWLGGFIHSITSLFTGNAKGGIYSGSGIGNYANKIVDSPTLFPFAKGGAIGLMGEAGSEAIMPLERNSRGELGVKVADSHNSGGNVYAPNITVQVESSGSGQMSDEQAQKIGKMVNEAVEVKVAESLSKYQRTGYFKNAYAR